MAPKYSFDAPITIVDRLLEDAHWAWWAAQEKVAGALLAAGVNPADGEWEICTQFRSDPARIEVFPRRIGDLSCPG